MNYFIALLISFFSLVANCQEKITFPVCVSYDMQLNFTKRETFSSTLLYNNNCAYFQYRSQEAMSSKDQDNDSEQTFSVRDTLARSVFSDKREKRVYEVVSGLNIRDQYLIKEELEAIHWEMLDETRVIESYRCAKAVCRFRGRNYTAWFTLDVPCGFGPWKLHGLPGLILEAYDDKHEVAFYAVKVSKTNEDFLWEEPPYKQLTRKEYEDKISEKFKDMMKRIASKADRGVKVTVSSSKIYGIEVYE